MLESDPCDGVSVDHTEKNSNIKTSHMGVILHSLKYLTHTAITYYGFSCTFIQRNEAASSSIRAIRTFYKIIITKTSLSPDCIVGLELI